MTANLRILAPTRLEYLATRLVRPAAPLHHVGMGLSRWSGSTTDALLLICGLAGALVPELEPGTVIVPDQVGLPDGRRFACDSELVAMLRDGAHAAGFPAVGGALLTAPDLVTGAARATWAERGFVAADMETGLLAGSGCRFATVRVILDTPARSIAAEWQSPAQALTRPALWPELLWMAGTAPRYALRAARVVRAACMHGPHP